MQRARFRLIVATVLFCAWIGWLAYLVATATRPVIVSRPQAAAAEIHVAARLEGDANKPRSVATILHVIAPPGQQDKLPAGTELEILYLDQCGPEQGWKGPGEYYLPLSQTKIADPVSKKVEFHYMLVPIPESLGYYPAGPLRLRIYPATVEVLGQIHSLLAHRP